LYLILTDPPAGYEKMAEFAVEAGLPALQLRYKGDDQQYHLDLAKRVRAITKDSKTLFIINDRPDIALMVGADGVHIGQSDLPAVDVRKCIGDRMLLGLSTHNLEQVNRSLLEPVDYIGIGPLYATTSKQKPDPVTGPEIVLSALDAVHCPVVAIGGLTMERIRALATGLCRNVAVISEVAMAKDPMLAMQTIQEIILEKI
jgi:thiamine-phosphate pyrophosphorylase